MDVRKLLIAFCAAATFITGIAYGIECMRSENWIYRTVRDFRRHFPGRLSVLQRNTDISLKHAVECPDNALVLLLMGQSNAANEAGRRYRGKSQVVNYFEGHCYTAEDPLLGGTGTAGSLWTPLANLLVDAGAEHVVLYNFAVGGSSVAQWNTEFRPELTAALNDLATRYRPAAILWQQGEADNGHMSGAEYREQLSTLIGFVHGRFPESRFVIATDSYCSGITDSAIEAAQMSVADGVSIFSGPNTDEIAAFDDRRDGCHFSDVGQQKASQAWFRAVTDLLVIPKRASR